jgi:D-alanyl-D-alanine carboxypeptidase
MKNLLFLLMIMLIVCACKKAQIRATTELSPAVPWQDTSSKHPMHNEFTSLVRKYTKLGLPGIAMLVTTKNGTWIGASGLADIETRIPFQPGQVSKAASITKLLTGALIFKLMEDSVHTGLGYGSLQMPVNTWIPKRITDKLPNGNIITLGQLLKHETGIPDLNESDAFYLAVLNDPNKKWKPEELLEIFYDTKPLFEPGDTAIYSNTNTVLAAMIIEYATGKSHAALLREKILQPLQMNATYYQPHDQLPKSTAQGYYDLYNDNRLVNVSNLVTGSGNGYGGIYSNVFDLKIFMDALLIRKTLLSEKSLRVMESYGKTDGTNRYGYGIMKKFIERGTDAGIGHSGRDVGYSANLFYFPASGASHIFFVNYGTDGKTSLRAVFLAFQEELLDLTLR